MKNANGTGSVRKRSDGRWEARYTAPDGIQRSVYGRTKQTVIEALKHKQAEMLLGTYVSPSGITVEQWLAKWLESYTPNIRETTRLSYTAMVRHFIPYIGRIQLHKLKRVHVQDALIKIEKELAPSSVKSVKIALSTAMSTAMQYDLIQANPCKGVKVPKATPREMRIIDRGQFQSFVDAANQTPCGAALILMLQTGLRSGELRGLRWSDLNWDAQTLSVPRQLELIKGKYVLVTPKTGKIRSIKLMDESIELLKQVRTQQMLDRIASVQWIENDLTRDLIFRQKSGDYYKADRLSYYATKVGKMIGIPDLSPHDLRHSYAVAALRAGIDIKTVQTNLGHSSAAMTLDIYAAYTTDMGTEAAAKMGAYWAKNTNG